MFVTLLKSVNRMYWLVVTILVLSPGLTVLGDQTCDEALHEMSACQNRTQAQYTEDSQNIVTMDQFARKTCNMMTNFYDCIVTLSKNCPRAEKPFLDNMIPAMDSMTVGIDVWDENKCPAALALKKKKPADCNQAIEDMHSCQNDAAEEATITNPEAQWDGRPAFAERLACNWVTKHYQHCMSKLVENRCFTMDELHDMFDEDYTSFMAEIVEALPDFDRRKCPITSESLTSWNSPPTTTSPPSGAASYITGSLVLSVTSFMMIFIP